MNVLSLLLATSCIGRTMAWPEVVDQFESRTFTRSVPDEIALPYRLYRPAIRDTQSPLPLVLWLHGLGEIGRDNRDQLAWLELVLIQQETLRTPDCVIVAPQCPPETPVWFGELSPGTETLEVIEQLIDELAEDNAVDPDRIYLAGISSGAAACWTLAQRRPQHYGAMVTFATAGGDVRAASRLNRLAIWAFHSTADSFDSQRNIAALIARASRAGGNAQLTLVDSDDHDCWTEGFTKYGAWSWLLAQRRGEPGRKPPATRSLTVTGCAAAAGLITLCLFTVARLFRSHQISADGR